MGKKEMAEIVFYCVVDYTTAGYFPQFAPNW